MLADGPHGQVVRTITDDTEMALCIARSLAERGTFEPADIADRFVTWKASGPFAITWSEYERRFKQLLANRDRQD